MQEVAPNGTIDEASKFDSPKTHSTPALGVTHPRSILRDLVHKALLNDHRRTDVSHISKDEPDAQRVLDMAWKHLNARSSSDTEELMKSENTSWELLSSVLKRICMKLAVEFAKLPSAIILQGITRNPGPSVTSGGFAEIFLGQQKVEENLKTVALKRILPNSSNWTNSGPQNAGPKGMSPDFCREVMLWVSLSNAHVLPLLDHGNVKDYSNRILAGGETSEVTSLPSRINKWLHQVALGLEYLHEEKIVHGDLHGKNILIERNEVARLTDFGLGVIAGASPFNYASRHGGGGFAHRSPELHSPESFNRCSCSDSSRRPTPASDVYAFACTVIELYTGNPPFGDETEHRLSKAVVSGRRPQRPATSKRLPHPPNPPKTSNDRYGRNEYAEIPRADVKRPELPISDSMWILTQRCWKQHPKRRPVTKEVARDMGIIVSELKLEPEAICSPLLDLWSMASNCLCCAA